MFPNDNGIFESCMVKAVPDLAGTGPNPYYQGLTIRDKDDLFPKAFSFLELNNVYAGLCSNNHDEGLICECPSLEELEYYNPGTEEVPDSFILEAITVDKFSRTEKRMAAVVRTFNRHLAETEIKALAPIVGKPKKSGTFAYVAVQLPFSDGQTVNVIFHSPEGDKKQIGANDSIIAFRWLLNKRDITQVVAPEDGAEVSLETIAKRVTQLVVKNSARFEKQQKAAQAERQELDKAREDVKTAEDKQRELMDNVASAAKEAEGIEAQLANTLSLLEKQKVINAELQAQIDALKKAPPKTGGSGPTPNDKTVSTTDLTELRAQIESWKNTLAELEKGVLSPQHVLGYRGSKKEARGVVNYEIERVEKQIAALEKELLPPNNSGNNPGNAGNTGNENGTPSGESLKLPYGYTCSVKEYQGKVENETKLAPKYKGDPANEENALAYACRYAKRNNEPIFVVPGNFRGAPLWHVFNKKSFKALGSVGQVDGYVVYPDGSYYLSVYDNRTPEQIEAQKQHEENERLEQEKKQALSNATNGEVSVEELEQQEDNRWDFAGDAENYIGSGMDRKELVDFFGNELKPIATLPADYLKFFSGSTSDPRVYCGKGYFIDHAVNHHPEIDPEEYKKIQDVISYPDEVIRDTRNDDRRGGERDCLIFVKNLGKNRAIVVEMGKDDEGHIVLHKTMMPVKEKPYPGLPRIQPVSVDGVPTIGRPENSGPGGSLSARDEKTINPTSVFVNDINDILAGKYDNDTKQARALLRAAIVKCKEDGITDQHEAILTQASDYLVGLMSKKREQVES